MTSRRVGLKPTLPAGAEGDIMVASGADIPARSVQERAVIPFPRVASMFTPYSMPGAFDPVECDRIIALAGAASLADAGLVRNASDHNIRRAAS